MEHSKPIPLKNNNNKHLLTYLTTLTSLLTNKEEITNDVI